MNWDAIGAIGEIVGASAVVCSLIYLAVQIRNQNKESQAAAVHEIIEGYRSSVAQLLESEMAEIWILGIDDYHQLSRTQKLRFDIYLMTTLRSFEDAYFQWKQKRLDDDIWKSALTPLIDLKATDAFGHYWQERKHQFRVEFADYVDKLEIGSYSYFRNPESTLDGTSKSHR